MKKNILVQTGERTETRIRTIPAQYNEMGEMIADAYDETYTVTVPIMEPQNVEMTAEEIKNLEAMQALAFAPTAEDRLTDVEQKAALLHMGCTVDDDGIVRWTAQEGENDAYTG